MQILSELAGCDLVIADLTDKNPNVMYEVGVRQALLRPLIFMCEKGQSLPFDLSDLRTVFYKLELEDAEQAKEELKMHFQNALSGPISAVDKALFVSGSDAQSPQPSSQEGQNLLAVMQVCENILHETQESKELLEAVAHVAVELRANKEAEEKALKDRQQQEMGMWMMQQFMQNPDGAEKAVPAMQALAEFGKSMEEASAPPPLNRAARRKQQK